MLIPTSDQHAKPVTFDSAMMPRPGAARDYPLRLLGVALFVAGLNSVLTTVEARSDDAPPSVVTCSFDQGYAWSYDAGQFANAAPKSLRFNITSIDLEAQTAVIGISDGSEGKLKVVRALNANHFLEVANEGFLNLTTVYDVDPATGRYPAVHSRHFGFMGQPVFAQYAGYCNDTKPDPKN